MKTNIMMLPEEILQMIFGFLSVLDLNTALLVCKNWREVAEKGKRWSRFPLNITENNLEFASDILRARRFQKLTTLNLMDRRYEDFHDRIHLFERLLNTIIAGGTSLKILDLKGTRLNSVHPSLLAKAVVKLKLVDLTETKLTTPQLEQILMCITQESNLTKLILKDNDLSFVSPDLLANAIHTLEEANIRGAKLRSNQGSRILTGLSAGSKLKKLNLSCNVLSRIDPVLLATTITRLTEVAIGFTMLEPQQAKAILESISKMSCLKTLHISSNDLSLVSPNILSGVVSTLEEVDLACTNLTPLQIDSIIAAICQDSRIQTLDLSGNNMSSVGPESLSFAVNKLKAATIHGSRLNNKHITTILKGMLDETNLKMIKITGIHKIGEVSMDLLKDAEEKVKNLSMRVLIT